MSALLEAAAAGGWLGFLAAMAAKATLVLLLAAVAAAVLARGSAAVRHLVWSLGIAGVLALPVLAVALPAWEVALPAAAVAPAWTAGDVAASAAEMPAPQATRTPAPRTAAAPAGARLAHVVPALAAAGVLVGILWLALGFWGVARMERRAEVVRDPEWLRVAHEASERLGLRRPVLLLRSRGPAMPATWGLLWPSVVLPSSADAWPDDLRRAVLAHELAHVKRFDCLTQALAQVACVLFWWHPAVWYAARRLRVERERACDDLVLGTGARASEYASHLLEIARTHRSVPLAAPAMVSMAKPSHLESRLLWVLDAARPRTAPSPRARALVLGATLLVVAPLAAMRPGVVVPAPAPPETWQEVPAPPAPPAEPPAPGYPSPPLAAGIAERGEPPALPTLPADTPRGGDAERSVERLVQMRAVGVTPEYVAEMRAAGIGPLTAEELVQLRAVGVDAAYAAEMGRAGMGRLTAAELTGLRAVGVTPEYLAELRRLGVVPRYSGQAKGLRSVGVTPEYVAELRRAGLEESDPDALIELRAVGVTPTYVREMREAGLGPLTARELVRLRASGVDSELARSRPHTP